MKIKKSISKVSEKSIRNNKKKQISNHKNKSNLLTNHI